MNNVAPLPEDSAYDFIAPEERGLVNEFLANGIVRVNVENKPALEKMQGLLGELAASKLGFDKPKDTTEFLNNIHQHVSVDKLNEFRLHVIDGMNKAPWFREAYYSLARKSLEVLVGNELVMQRKVNLSIQLPDDDSSLLPIHSDVWSGDSPFEVVLWVPYVDCFKTKSMYFCKAGIDGQVQPNLKDFQGKTSEDLYAAIAKDAPFWDVPFGTALIFTQNIMHGNRINVESETRWSSNCRFKSALSPYADKKLGEFFEPITLRPTTRLGMRYQLPQGFDE